MPEPLKQSGSMSRRATRRPLSAGAMPVARRWPALDATERTGTLSGPRAMA